jgi:hypothetical protein
MGKGSREIGASVVERRAGEKMEVREVPAVTGGPGRLFRRRPQGNEAEPEKVQGACLT